MTHNGSQSCNLIIHSFNLFIFSWVRTRTASRGPVVAITAARKGGVNWTKDSQSNTLFLMILLLC